MVADLVSIIMPTYNSELTVVSAIESVLQQSYTNWELLITDDKSTDKTCHIVTELARTDNRIRVFKLDYNSGAGVARNVSIGKARGRYIAFLDSDDTWHNEKLHRHLNFMDAENIALSYTAYNVYNEMNIFIRTVRIKPKVSFEDMLKSNYIGCSTAIYDASILGKQYMPSIRKRQDYGLWISILRTCGSAYGLNEILTNYSQLPGSVSSKKFSLIRDQYLFFRKEINLGILGSFKSTLYSIIYKISSIKDNGK